jgi:hypothetical protein
MLKFFLGKFTIDYEKDLVVINNTVFGNYNSSIWTCFADVTEIGKVALMTFLSDSHVSTYLTLLKQSKTYALKSF